MKRYLLLGVVTTCLAGAELIDIIRPVRDYGIPDLLAYVGVLVLWAKEIYYIAGKLDGLELEAK